MSASNSRHPVPTVVVDGFVFPDPSGFPRANVVLMYTQLIRHGEERLCVGGAAWNENEVCVHHCERLSLLLDLYGLAARPLVAGAEWSLVSLRMHLEQQPPGRRTVAAWRAPIDGIHLVESTGIAAPSVEALLRARLAQYASLYDNSEPAKEI